MYLIFIDNNPSTMISQLLSRDTSQLLSVITKIHPSINRHIKFETLIQFLNHYKIFTDDEMQYFNNKHISLVEKGKSLNFMA